MRHLLSLCTLITLLLSATFCLSLKASKYVDCAGEVIGVDVQALDGDTYENDRGPSDEASLFIVTAAEKLGIVLTDPRDGLRSLQQVEAAFSIAVERANSAILGGDIQSGRDELDQFLTKWREAGLPINYYMLYEELGERNTLPLDVAGSRRLRAEVLELLLQHGARSGRVPNEPIDWIGDLIVGNRTLEQAEDSLLRLEVLLFDKAINLNLYKSMPGGRNAYLQLVADSHFEDVDGVADMSAALELQKRFRDLVEAALTQRRLPKIRD